MAYRNNDFLKERVLLDIQQFISTIKAPAPIELRVFFETKYEDYETILSPKLISLTESIVNYMSQFDYEESKKSVQHVLKQIPVFIENTDKLVYTFFYEIVQGIIRNVSFNSVYQNKDEIISFLRVTLNIFNSLLNSNITNSLADREIENLMNMTDTAIATANYFYTQAEEELKNSISQSLAALLSIKSMFDEDLYSEAIKNIIIVLSNTNENDYAYYSFELRNKLRYNSIATVKKEYQTPSSTSDRIKNIFTKMG